VPATYGNGSVEVRSAIDGGHPDAVWFAACRARRNPRRPQGQRYSLSHLLLFSVLAVLAGATSYQKIITFIAVQRLNAAFGACLRRAPAVNTLRRLFLARGTISRPPSAVMRTR
jgi:hypothetical protein